MSAEATLLAQAFASDPLCTFMVPEAGAREIVLPWFFEACVRHAQRSGGVVSRSGGAALWLRGQMGPGVAEGFRCGLGALPLRIGFGTTLRLARHEGRGHDLLHARGVTSYGYLWFAGVAPEARGKGISRELVEDVTRAVRAAGLPTCFLTTENPANVTVWTRNGFQVVGHHPRTPAGLPVWLMERPLT